MQRLAQITRGRLSRPLLRRSFYSHASEYVTLDRQGKAVKRAVDIWVGDPHETFVLVPKEIGSAMKMAINEGTSSSAAVADRHSSGKEGKKEGECSLMFNHSTRHLAHRKSCRRSWCVTYNTSCVRRVLIV